MKSAIKILQAALADIEAIRVLNQEGSVYKRMTLMELGKAIAILSQYEENSAETQNTSEKWEVEQIGQPDESFHFIVTEEDEERIKQAGFLAGSLPEGERDLFAEQSAVPEVWEAESGQGDTSPEGQE